MSLSFRLLKILIVVLSSGFLVWPHQALAACSPQTQFGGAAPAPGAGSGSAGSSADQMLEKAIAQHQLDRFTPAELSKCSDKKKMWHEFLRGLAYIESSWDTNCHTPNDANGKPSDGLFQMTVGDTALGQACFQNGKTPFDAEANIDCAVRKMKELQGGGGSGRVAQTPGRKLGGWGFEDTGGAGQPLKGNIYWGPLKRWDPKAEKIVEIVNSKVCGGVAPVSTGSAGAAGLDWSKELSGVGGSAPSGGTSPKPGGRG